MTTIVSSALISNPTVMGEFSLVKGTDLASAVAIYTGTGAGEGLQTLLASKQTAEFDSSAEIDGAVGIAYKGDTSQLLFVRKSDSTQLTDAVFLAPSSAGTITRSRADASGAGFVAGVAIGVALGSR